MSTSSVRSNVKKFSQSFVLSYLFFLSRYVPLDVDHNAKFDLYFYLKSYFVFLDKIRVKLCHNASKWTLKWPVNIAGLRIISQFKLEGNGAKKMGLFINPGNWSVLSSFNFEYMRKRSKEQISCNRHYNCPSRPFSSFCGALAVFDWFIEGYLGLAMSRKHETITINSSSNIK